MSNLLTYASIPKDLEGNIEFRRTLLNRAADNKPFQKLIWDSCAADVRVYVNLFGYTIDPRRRDIRKLPFITYPFQDDVLLELVELLGRTPIAIEKSRGVGITVLVVALFNWRVKFFRWEMFGMMSMKADLVDSSGGTNAATLFGKHDFLEWCLPAWMRPKAKPVRKITPPTYINNDTNSSLHGESLTTESWRQYRMAAIFVDEHSAYLERIASELNDSISGTTNCPIYVGTHRGTGTEFYRQTRGENPAHVITVGWWQNPAQAKGLYYVDPEGRIEIRDKAFWEQLTVRDARMDYSRVCGRRMGKLSGDTLAKDYYPFNGAGPNTDEWDKIRSPYYDETCCDLGNRKSIAKELDINPLASGDDYFEPEEVVKLMQKTREPELTGMLGYDPYSIDPEGFLQSRTGLWKLWFAMSADGRPPLDKYFIGADVSSGRKTTLSCMKVACRSRGIVCSYASNQISPYKFAEVLIATSRWFYRAPVIYEKQGPGDTVTHRAKEIGYLEKIYRSPGSKNYGLVMTAEVKQLVLENYGAALGNGDLAEPDSDTIRELPEFQWHQGILVHRAAMGDDDQGSKKKQHGDRVMAGAVLWFGMGGKGDSRVLNQASADDSLVPYSPAWYEQKGLELATTGPVEGNTLEYFTGRPGPESPFS